MPRLPQPESTSVPSAWSIRGWRDRLFEIVMRKTALRHQRRYVAATLALVVIIGAVDYWTGFELSLLVFYFIPISLAVVTWGWQFGILTAVVSILTWLGGDFAAGAHFASLLVASWNALIALGTYLIVIWLLSSLLGLYRQQEGRIAQRTLALRNEILERERLEKAIIDLGERERQVIGRDLHDGLSQHLTGTSLVAQALVARLAARSAAETADLDKLVGLIEQGIEQTRGVARGLLLAEIEREGLEAALEEFAASASRQFRVTCEFVGQRSPGLRDASSATHLYRIAQEAVRNGIRHGRARRLAIELSHSETELTLRVRDDGSGLPPRQARGSGLGLRIMAHRAEMLGGTLSIEANPDGGTVVTCCLPRAFAAS